MKLINFGLSILILFILFAQCSKSKDTGLQNKSPIISSFSPLSGKSGTSVTISGSNFGSDPLSNIVTIAGVNIQPTLASSTQLVFVIPNGLQQGVYLITVTVGNQTSSSTQSFTIKPEPAITDPEVLNYNYSIGTQTIGPSYGFTSDDRLVETAKAILEMGSNILKISLATKPYSDMKQNPSASPIELAKDNPSFSQVLDMPFNYYFFWALSNSKWKDGYSVAERMEDSIQIADLTSYLLTKYNNSGKQFFLGHWEGDWYLLDNYDTNFIPSDESINGMIQWYIARQNAVDQAIKNTPHNNVEVFTYAEVNRVVDAMKGKPRVVNKVLPYTNVDYVSYSSYDAQKFAQPEYNAVLDYIEANLPVKPQLKGKRVFIGEMGIKAKASGFSKSQHEAENRENISKALVWGTPFVLYWEMYNNEIENGIQQGLWLIDDKNEKWPLYYTFSNFYEDAKNWVATQKKNLNRLPTREEYLNWAAPRL